ncbi:hypothetical protein SK128_027037 [Halocaridina rubra]|uniref:Uncharacterized protein n=1 Tax=Halocaridina rubra TaxID=373956 RepID=A0AAN8XJW1_HALRR
MMIKILLMNLWLLAFISAILSENSSPKAVIPSNYHNDFDEQGITKINADNNKNNPKNGVTGKDSQSLGETEKLTTLDEAKPAISRQDHNHLKNVFLPSFNTNISHEITKRNAENDENTPKNGIIGKYSKLLEEKDKIATLSGAITAISRQDLAGCVLTLAFDSYLEDSAIVTSVLKSRHLRQVLKVRKTEDFLTLPWNTSLSSQCQGYIFLLRDPEPLLTFVDEAEEPWDFHGKYILVGFSKAELEQAVSSKKGKKTEHIVGIVEGSDGSWRLYMNQLYWKDGMEFVKSWRHNGFTSAANLFPDKTSDLKGIELTLITFEFAPHIIYGRGGRGPSGRDMQVANALSQSLNFTLRYKEPPPGELWGSKLPNGTWTGLVASLARNEGHMGMANVFLSNNNDRILVQDFSRFYDADVSCFMARTDPPLPRWQSLALPFQLETWLAIMLGLFIFCPLLFCIGKASAL